jgi:cell division protein FtsZ
MNPPAFAASDSTGLLCVGVGRAGGNLIHTLAGRGLTGTRLKSLGTAEFPEPVAGVELLPLGHDLTRGFGCGGDLAHGRQAAEKALGLIRDAVRGAKVVVLLAGLGGGTGGGAGPMVARAASEAGALVIALVTTPFSFEAPLRHGNAKASLQALRAAADVVLCLSNAAASRMLDEKTRLPEVMANSNAIIGEALCGLWRMLNCPGLLPIGAGAMERMLRGLHGESSFATVEGRGENRAREAFELLQRHAFLQGDCSPGEAEAVLVNIATNGDLRLDELEWLQRQFQGWCERARLVVGATDDPALNGRLSLTAVAARTGIVPVVSPSVAAILAPVAAEPATRYEAGVPRAPVILDGLDLDTGAPLRATGLFKAAGEAPRKAASAKIAGKRKPEQQNFNFDLVSKGRFEHTESTFYEGQNLDEPTFLRRGITLN